MEMREKKHITIKLGKQRNPFAVGAKQRRAGQHCDRRKKAACEACRGKDWNE